MAVLNSNLPHWFRFSPTDEEAIKQILIQKITGNDKEVWFIREIDFYKHEPCELPHFSGIATKDLEWFFFTQQKRKHQNGNGIDRLTKDGYWKSTGNDKEIFSGESLIGKKKILVFLTGRPPKGKGTCWVMHEYRTTLKEYDGTKPGQKAFVLCRLFEKNKTKKKSKPALAHVSPASEVQAQTHQTSNPSCGADKMQIELVSSHCIFCPVTNDLNSGHCGHPQFGTNEFWDLITNVPDDEPLKNMVSVKDSGSDARLANAQPDLELERHLDMLYEPEPQDWTLPSPIQAEMQVELGSSDISLLAHNDFISGNNGVQFPHGSNESDDISEFLESVLRNPEECSYDEFDNLNNLAYDGQTSMKTEVVNELLQAEEIIDRKPHLQMETTPLQNPVSSGGGAEQIYDSSLKESNNHLSAFASGEVRNGFSITPRQRQNQPSNENSMTQMQGTAPRRLRLQCKLQVQPLTTSLMSEDCSYTTEDHELKPVATEEEKASEKHAVASGHSAAASALSEPQKILSDSTENCKTPQEPNTIMRPSLKLQGNILTGTNVFSLLSKAPPVHHSNWPLALLFRVVVIAVLFIIFASIWRCLKF